MSAGTLLLVAACVQGYDKGSAAHDIDGLIYSLYD